jgi:hypothetical protein
MRLMSAFGGIHVDFARRFWPARTTSAPHLDRAARKRERPAIIFVLISPVRLARLAPRTMG